MNRDLLLVALALFTWGMGESAYYFFQPLYLEQLGASPITIGTILGAAGIAMTISHIPAGYLADRIGRRTMMWAAWFTGVLSGSIMTAARSLPVFTVGLLLYGVTMFVIAPLNSYVTAARGRLSVGRVITITSAAYNTGAIFGPILGGKIGESYGFSSIYLYATVVFVISTIIILFLRPQPTEKDEEVSSRNGLLNRSYLGFLPIFFLATLGMYISQPLAPNFLQNTHSLSLSQIGVLGSINSLGNVLLNLVIGSLNNRMGFILGQVVAGLFPLLLWRGTGFSWFAVAYFMLGGFRSAKAMATAQIRSYISSANMGLAYGIAETVSGVGIIIAPPLAGFLYEGNPFWIFQTAIGIIITSIILTIVFTKKDGN
jgi:MFS family permease